MMMLQQWLGVSTPIIALTGGGGVDGDSVPAAGAGGIPAAGSGDLPQAGGD